MVQNLIHQLCSSWRPGLVQTLSLHSFKAAFSISSDVCVGNIFAKDMQDNNYLYKRLCTSNSMLPEVQYTKFKMGINSGKKKRLL